MIYGERLRLRAPERADLPRFVSWLNDPEVRQYLLMSLPMSLASEERWFENMSQRPPAEQILVIEIPEGEAAGQGWRMIGTTAFHDIDWMNRSAEIGIMIGEKSFWNQGYGRETMRLMLRHGFGTLNLNRIFLRVHEPNARGIRAYERAGFQHEGRLRQAQFKDGHYYDILVMSVLREEWEQAAEKTAQSAARAAEPEAGDDKAASNGDEPFKDTAPVAVGGSKSGKAKPAAQHDEEN